MALEVCYKSGNYHIEISLFLADYGYIVITGVRPGNPDRLFSLLN